MAKATNRGDGIALVISDMSSSGGAQRVVATLANAWAARGRNVLVITFDDGLRDFFPLDARVQRIALDLMQESRSALSGIAANLRRILILRRILAMSDISTAVAFVGATNILTVLAGIGLDRRVVISERNDPARQSLGQPWDWLRERLYRYADLVTANSRAALLAMGRYVPAEKLAHVPNPLGIDPARTGARGASRTILTVGRLDRQKGHDVLLEAFARSRARSDGWRLAIVGDGPLADPLGAQAEALGVADQVAWHGWVSDPSVCYAASAVFVLASRHEGTPNVVLEALSAGLPVIVTEACGGALEFVKDEDTGLVVPTEDPDALAAAIDRLADRAELRESLGEAGRRRLGDGHPERALARWDAVLSPEGRLDETSYAPG